MSLLGLPECRAWPWVKAFEREGWTVPAAYEQPSGAGVALMTRAHGWAIGRYDGREMFVELAENERSARNAIDRELPPDVPRLSSGS